MGDAWTAWTDGEFLSYVEEHSGTELALFLPEQALRLYDLAESPAPYLGRGMVSLGPYVAGPLVAKARARLQSKALHDGGSIMDAYKDKRISLSVRAVNAVGHLTIGEVRAMTDNDLWRIRTIGQTTIAELRDVLGPHDPTAGYRAEDPSTWSREQLVTAARAKMLGVSRG